MARLSTRFTECAHGRRAALGAVASFARVSQGQSVYHVSPSELEIGSRLRHAVHSSRPHSAFFCTPAPRIADVDAKYWSYRLVEQVFERIRIVAAADAPSRETALFTFVCLGCATEFRNRSRRDGTIYGLAVPDARRWRRQIAKIPLAIRRMLGTLSCQA